MQLPWSIAQVTAAFEMLVKPRVRAQVFAYAVTRVDSPGNCSIWNAGKTLAYNPGNCSVWNDGQTAPQNRFKDDKASYWPITQKSTKLNNDIILVMAYILELEFIGEEIKVGKCVDTIWEQDDWHKV